MTSETDISINLKDVRDMFSEKDMQNLQFRTAIRELSAEIEQKTKTIKELQEELEKCRQNSTESDIPQ